MCSPDLIAEFNYQVKLSVELPYRIAGFLFPVGVSGRLSDLILRSVVGYNCWTELSGKTSSYNFSQN